MLKLFLIKRTDYINWDMYDSFVVCAENEEKALDIMPGDLGENDKFQPNNYGWVKDKANLTCVELGVANENMVEGAILGSYNAG